MEPKNNHRKAAQTALNDLAATSADALRRALDANLDMGFPVLLTESDSKIAIAQEIRRAMMERQLTPFLVSEMSGLAVEVIESFLEARAQINDSQLITDLEAALGISLRHL